MADQPDSPSPQAASAAPKFAAPKDRQCIFCSQWFTSSSLGRHYDQFVKPNNPKGPDGLHDVHIIAQIRGGITRRQARSSRRTGAQSSTSQPSSENLAASQAVSPPSTTTTGERLETMMGFRLNKMPWYITGVINDLPIKDYGPSITEPRKEGQRPLLSKSELEERANMLKQIETGQAADRALREVLSRLGEASARLVRQTLFDFDPFALDFPSLCLHLLKSPPTLFSPTPFPSHDSWSIEPPGQKQFDALRNSVMETLSCVKRVRSAAQAGQNQDQNSKLDDDAEQVLAHIAEAWKHWSSISEHSQREAWQLETLRHLARTNESNEKAEITIDTLRVEIDDLFSKLNRQMNTVNSDLSDRLSPSILYPSTNSGSTLRLSNKVIKNLVSQAYEPIAVDHKALLKKHVKAIRGENSTAYPMLAEQAMEDDFHSVSSRNVSSEPPGGSGASDGTMNSPANHYTTTNTTAAAAATTIATTAERQPTSNSPTTGNPSTSAQQHRHQPSFFDDHTLVSHDQHNNLDLTRSQLPARLTLDLQRFQRPQTSMPSSATSTMTHATHTPPPSGGGGQHQHQHFRWPLDAAAAADMHERRPLSAGGGGGGGGGGNVNIGLASPIAGVLQSPVLGFGQH